MGVYKNLADDPQAVASLTFALNYDQDVRGLFAGPNAVSVRFAPADVRRVLMSLDAFVGAPPAPIGPKGWSAPPPQQFTGQQSAPGTVQFAPPTRAPGSDVAATALAALERELQERPATDRDTAKDRAASEITP